jgi:hypothetical protein
VRTSLAAGSARDVGDPPANGCSVLVMP